MLDRWRRSSSITRGGPIGTPQRLGNAPALWVSKSSIPGGTCISSQACSWERSRESSVSASQRNCCPAGILGLRAAGIVYWGVHRMVFNAINRVGSGAGRGTE